MGSWKLTVCVIKDILISSKLWFFSPASLKTLILLLLLLSAVSVARADLQGQWLFPAPLLAEHTSPILGLLSQGWVIQSQGDPGLQWTKSTGISSLFVVSFYPTSCVISPPCMVIYSLTCASGCLFHPCRKHQLLPDGCTFIKHSARTGQSSFIHWQLHAKGRENAFLSLHFYLCVYLSVSTEEKIVNIQQLPQLWTALNYRHSHGFT